MKSLITTIATFLCLTSVAQQLHTPAELMKIMEDSKLSYSINILDKEIPNIDYSERLNSNDFYRVIEDGNIATKEFEVSEEGKGYFDKAEEYFSKENPQKAREMYQIALEYDSNCYFYLTYIGQTYERERNFEQAEKYYKKAISKNYIDYLAHWFLADIYSTTKRIDKAVDEITIAKILNRNNKNIDVSLERIYAAKKLKYPKWQFNPQIKIEKQSDKSVAVSFGENWTGYAIAKALWAYEPGYRGLMGVSDSTFSSVEEKECIVGLLSGIYGEKKKIKSNPAFAPLCKALDQKMLDAYIVYEIFLPQYPSVAHQLSEEFINQIKDYVLTVRCGK